MVLAFFQGVCVSVGFGDGAAGACWAFKVFGFFGGCPGFVGVGFFWDGASGACWAL